MIEDFYGDGSKAIIDLSAIQQNFFTIKKHIGEKVVVAAVVKNNAYGMGISKVAVSLFEVGCRDFWVAYLSEAIILRSVLPKEANIYILHGVRNNFSLVKEYNLIPVINSINVLKAICGKNISFVVNIDSGISRLGLRKEDIKDAIEMLKNEDVRYIMSHLSCGDDSASIFNSKEKDAFDEILKMFKDDVKASLSASGGAFLSSEFHYDMVRVGAFLYGIKSDAKQHISPKNVFSIKAEVLQKYDIKSNTKVGYGVSYVAQKKTKIAILSIGYGDGMLRQLANCGKVVFGEVWKEIFYAPIIGAISMDLMAIDVSLVPDALTEVGTWAQILCEKYSINEMAKDANTIPYEILGNLKLSSNRFDIKYI